MKAVLILLKMRCATVKVLRERIERKGLLLANGVLVCLILGKVVFLVKVLGQFLPLRVKYNLI